MSFAFFSCTELTILLEYIDQLSTTSSTSLRIKETYRKRFQNTELINLEIETKDFSSFLIENIKRKTKKKKNKKS